ncbi:MAG: pyridoxal-phosphate dependent enzyme [Wenzhouxiangellaceae bacterium]|nr:MAG: pyridoxal-phosphate dependent enzyme [Wenzhouxiangellaceae bacterium]
MTERDRALPDFRDIEAAARRLDGLAHRTPVLTSSYFNGVTGAELYFKCENFQKVGAFKFRGACNAIGALPAELARRGIVTHSSGNHGQAVALAAAMNGLKAVVVMPKDSAQVKLDAVRGYGGEVVLCEPGTANREATVRELIERHGYHEIPPYDHPDIIAGQGTAALELLQDVPELDVIMAPVGGGGLISGTAIAARHFNPAIRVIGAEPANADDAARSLRSGRIEPAAATQTVADGLRATLGVLNFAVIERYVDDIVTVSEQAVIDTTRAVWARMKIIIEPSCAVPLAALIEGRYDARSRKVGIILTGGNVDIDQFVGISRGG